ncbi:AraC family transcriptional regulator [Paenibacillus sp. ACRRY]|uniref:AraC family transcriptional regulator n=1 Tax=Paenibacillus TaxID=44249 RepID=UPI001EF5FB9A|nr:AraC family transcriptional regulator [Paenibacillus sp. ACRRY]MCG7381693.1 AraC family transcriptional regulator [Paenibacillus sp. ACRRY]
MFLKPIRKPFFGDPLFPFELTYKLTKHQSNELPDHLHDRYELVYIHQGKGTFFIDNNWYEKKQGDLFIIPGNTIHHSMPHIEDPIVSSALFFAPNLLSMDPIDDSYKSLLCFDYAIKKRNYRIELPEYLIALTENALKQIQHELIEKKIGYQEAIKLICCQFFLQINRYIQSIRGRSAVLELKVGPYWMKDIVHDIDKHPGRVASLSQLAAKANVTAPHFSRVFRRMTTMNFTQYVNVKRIILAKGLLIGSDKKITEIAELCGYDSPTHFYRMFKSLTGVTPNKYRQHSSKL